MKAILILFFGLSVNMISTSDMIFNFGNGQNQIHNWVLISDNIMGGVSKSNLEESISVNLTNFLKDL